MTTAIERIATEGFALLRSYRHEEAGRAAFASIGSLLSISGFAEVQVLTPRRLENSTPNTYSGNFGYGIFPLHTDLAHWARPPRYVALRCVQGASDVPTFALDGNGLLARFGSLTMRRTLVQPRRPLGGSRALLRLREVLGPDTSFIRWDSIFLRPATPASHETFQAVGDYLRRTAAQNVTLRNPGDTLILDNWRMLHGRGAVPEHSYDRRVERAYLGELF